MIITSGIREQLLNIYSDDSETPWTNKRIKEIGDAPVDRARLEALRIDLNARVRAFAQRRSYRAGWQTCVIDTAAAINDLHMLEFFDRLLAADHTPVLLRIVFTHAVNYSIPLKSIDAQKLDAYRGVTRTMLHDFDTKVQYIGLDQGEALIARILGSDVEAGRALAFIADRGHNDPDTLIAHLDKLRAEVPVLESTDA
jgi:hypothetical protein